MPASIESVVSVLERALQPQADMQAEIKKAQQIVWDQPSEDDGGAWQILRDLAHDLDYFEPDVRKRAQDASFFGDDRAREEIQSALNHLRSLTA